VNQFDPLLRSRIWGEKTKQNRTPGFVHPFPADKPDNCTRTSSATKMRPETDNECTATAGYNAQALATSTSRKGQKL
uniref:Uncharacterized protein n=1 Tax=Anopheles arabiensis TaxID=7173 RepID=A0A182IGZ3_ANOAR